MKAIDEDVKLAICARRKAGAGFHDLRTRYRLTSAELSQVLREGAGRLRRRDPNELSRSGPPVEHSPPIAVPRADPLVGRHVRTWSQDDADYLDAVTEAHYVKAGIQRAITAADLKRMRQPALTGCATWAL